MALQMDKVLSSGITANYFKVSQINIVRTVGVVICDVDIYLNADARKSGMIPVSRIQYQFEDLANFISVETNVITRCYDMLKAMDDFKDAKDV